MSPAKRAGFSILEILVVVTIVLILGSIALPSYVSTLTRSKVARTQADIHNVCLALTSYNIDMETFPGDSAEDPFGALGQLTTPLPYLEVLPSDVFRVRGDPHFRQSFFYSVKSGDFDSELSAVIRSRNGNEVFSYGICGYGPDGRFARGIETDVMDYDASNGTFSRGNIWYLGQ